MLQRSVIGGSARGSLLESESAFIGKTAMMQILSWMHFLLVWIRVCHIFCLASLRCRQLTIIFTTHNHPNYRSYDSTVYPLWICVVEMPGPYFAFGYVLRPLRRCLSSATYPRVWENPTAVSQGEEEAGQTVTASPGTLPYTPHTPHFLMYLSWPVNSNAANQLSKLQLCFLTTKCYCQCLLVASGSSCLQPALWRTWWLHGWQTVAGSRARRWREEPGQEGSSDGSQPSWQHSRYEGFTSAGRYIWCNCFSFVGMKYVS